MQGKEIELFKKEAKTAGFQDKTINAMLNVHISNTQPAKAPKKCGAEVEEEDCFDYFIKNGYTQENRNNIADYTQNYAENLLSKSIKFADEAMNKCSIYDEDSYIANYKSPDIKMIVDDLTQKAKELTQFKSTYQNYFYQQGHSMYNPVLNPMKDYEKEITYYLGMPYEEFCERNAEVLEELKNKNPEELL